MQKPSLFIRRFNAIAIAIFSCCLPSSAEQDTETAFPSFPPAPPREMLNDRAQFTQQVRRRRFGAPRGVLKDQPQYALFRLYEHIMLDDNIGMRNELESFWWKPWPVHEIPDPADHAQPERYAVLACIPALLVEAFNQRIDIGLRRQGDSIMNEDEREALARSLPATTVYEQLPPWTRSVEPLEQTLYIPHEMEGLPQLSNLDDDRASPAFREKNILLWHPHIHFV
ncbi:hypothetical protein AC578_4490 [Pseudocercospora eumusae]|uniref:Tyrosinase copper-binding domain-containing protein n=1 Tax=Pseudocercospora eumusae TaxID=321146 RepID=A0A139HBX5_9PEZI|nr:hypothetical protein AC578_4490 [Pseudocercospora eumusae]